MRLRPLEVVLSVAILAVMVPLVWIRGERFVHTPWGFVAFMLVMAASGVLTGDVIYACILLLNRRRARKEGKRE